jgi:hypothetical protein
MHHIENIRQNILDFENALNCKTPMTIHHYIVVFENIDKWNEYHKKYKDLNGILDATIKAIQKNYTNRKIKEGDDF